MPTNQQTYRRSLSLKRRVQRAMTTIGNAEQRQAELQQCRAIYQQLIAQGMTCMPALPSTLPGDPLADRAPAAQRKNLLRMKAMAKRILNTRLPSPVRP